MQHKETRQTTPEEEGIELDPNAWDRFPNFVKEIAKAGPQHRTPKTDPRAPSPKRAGKRDATKLV
jgi:hypothetical protein